jgi:hypothetical protein
MRVPDLAKEVISPSGQQGFDQNATNCSDVLGCLGKTWSVAKDAREKFENLAALTKETIKNKLRTGNTEITVVPDSDALPPSRLASNIESVPDQRLQPDGLPIGTSYGVEGNLTFGDSDFLWDELGDMSTWFDLTWVGEQTNPNGTISQL